VLNSLVAFVIAGVVSLLSGPAIIRLLISMKARQTIREDVPQQHQAKQGTPTMGGLIIFLGAAAGIAFSLLIIKFRYASAYDPKVWPVLVLTLGSGLVGFIDDFLIARRGKNLGLKARQKLAGQFILAIGFVLWIVQLRTHDVTAIMLWDRAIDLGWAYYPLAVLLVVGMSNAVNLTDGLDGLVGGLAGVSMLTIGAVAGHDLRFALAAVAYAVAGGCVGFLYHNAHPAKVFMGDTGSLAIGAVVAGLAIAARQEVLVLLIGLIFVIEALSVILQVISFKTTGRRIFKMSPIHHHFELSGWPETLIVKRFWLFQLFISAFVLIRWLR
jgi:phospho-N-acetylmuramoyl-pentapeptide-transferase